MDDVGVLRREIVRMFGVKLEFLQIMRDCLGDLISTCTDVRRAGLKQTRVSTKDATRVEP